MGKVGGCSRERSGPGSNAARMDNVPIGEEIAEPRTVGAGGDTEAVSRATEEEFPFAAVNLVVGVTVYLERTRGCTRGQGVVARGGASTVEGE